MRIRKKPYARPELEASSFFCPRPYENRGKWRSVFGNEKPLFVELGCGKGGFISQISAAHMDVNYIGIDIKDEMVVLAKRKVQALQGTEDPKNVILTCWNIERIGEMFSPEDRIDGLYINFCNPWPKKKHKKHRLTHPDQLKRYAGFLRDGAELSFKTDDDELFSDTIGYLENERWEIIMISEDLSEKPFEEDFETEHEKMFREDGLRIKGLKARFRRCSE